MPTIITIPDDIPIDAVQDCISAFLFDVYREGFSYVDAEDAGRAIVKWLLTSPLDSLIYEFNWEECE